MQRRAAKAKQAEAARAVGEATQEKSMAGAELTRLKRKLADVRVSARV
jgi:hypothetical protein